jgi:hypothetical protein
VTDNRTGRQYEVGSRIGDSLKRVHAIGNAATDLPISGFDNRIHESTVTYAIASKMLFASRYFGAALELKSVVPDTASTDSKTFYLVCLNRSFVDGLTGFRGALIRGTVLKKSRQSLAGYLAGVKQKLESAYSREVK